MIVCSCRNINESTISNAVGSGARSLNDLSDLGVGSCCGSCVDYARMVLDRELMKKNMSNRQSA